MSTMFNLKSHQLFANSSSHLRSISKDIRAAHRRIQPKTNKELDCCWHSVILKALIVIHVFNRVALKRGHSRFWPDKRIKANIFSMDFLELIRLAINWVNYEISMHDNSMLIATKVFHRNGCRIWCRCHVTFSSFVWKEFDLFPICRINWMYDAQPLDTLVDKVFYCPPLPRQQLVITILRQRLLHGSVSMELVLCLNFSIALWLSSVIPYPIIELDVSLQPTLLR